MGLTVSDSVIGSTNPVSGAASSADIAAADVVFEAPDIWSLSAGASCDGDLIGPLPGGNLHDLGPSDQTDGDGSRADIGATGGPDGYTFDIPSDADGDGFLSLAAGGEDCDDLDPLTFPSAVEDVGPDDRDCDGHTDPTDPIRLRGCSTAPSGGMGWSVLLLLLLRTRRQSSAFPCENSP